MKFFCPLLVTVTLAFAVLTTARPISDDTTSSMVMQKRYGSEASSSSAESVNSSPRPSFGSDAWSNFAQSSPEFELVQRPASPEPEPEPEPEWDSEPESDNEDDNESSDDDEPMTPLQARINFYNHYGYWPDESDSDD